MPKKLPRILVIVGPTASGKSALALKLSKKLGGEIVSADSRLIYRGMDIGTVKPTRAERAAVPHHLIDLVPPSKTMTLAEWKKRALRAIRGVLKRGQLPIVVGGTGLYVRALVENLEIPEVAPDRPYRAFLARKGGAWILARLRKLDPAYADRIGPNPRYATRALEVIRATGKPFSAQQGRGKPLFDVVAIGLDPSKTLLERRIKARVRAMFKSGLENEARRLRRKYPGDLPAMSGIGYREFEGYFEGLKGRKEVLEAIVRNTKAYAKRQMTWFKRMGGITWTKTSFKADFEARKALGRNGLANSA